MFKLIAEENGARTGELKTAHGTIRTPAFIPVATKATVKTLNNEELKETRTDTIIANAFHLYITAFEAIRESGGLHNFMNWKEKIFTDSGGFQIIRKDFRFRITENGIEYRDPKNGRKETYTPELCMKIQNELDSDVAMVLDHCPPHNATREEIIEATNRTTRWAERSKEAHNPKKEQQLFAIIQGGTDPKLREKNTHELTKIDFDGYAIGGLSIGEPKELMQQTLNHTTPLLPSEKPRYLMGVGSTPELLNAIATGIDIFDSTYPTRNARHASITTRNKRINITRQKYKNDQRPLEKDCTCYTCQHHTRAYLHHLFKQKEPLAQRLATIHNIHHTQRLMHEIQTAIEEGWFQKLREEILQEELTNTSRRP